MSVAFTASAIVTLIKLLSSLCAMNDLVIVLNEISHACWGHTMIQIDSLETDCQPIQSIELALQCFET